MQVDNSCHKSVYEITPIQQLKRFFVLGNESGTYYVCKEDVQVETMECLETLLKDDCHVILDLIKEVYNKVYKRDYVILVLARCCASRDIILRKRSYEMLDVVCKTPTHLFMFIEHYESWCKLLYGSTGWNPMHKKYVGEWYISKQVVHLAYLVTKYKNRNNWKHQDILKLTHIKAPESLHDCLFAYLVNGYEAFKEKMLDCDDNGIEEFIDAYEALKACKDCDEAAELIDKHNFVREHVPLDLLSNKKVWGALLKKMPDVALLRNMNKITQLGILDDPLKLTQVQNKLQNLQAHPLQVLVALHTYSKGRGFKGSLTWQPNDVVCTELNSAFHAAFTRCEPTNKRFLVALDVSGSMTSNNVCGLESMMASEIATAMAMVFARTEPVCDIMGFRSNFVDLNISLEKSLQENMSCVYGNTFDTTDIAVPFLWALKNKKEYDCIIVITDNETNFTCPSMNPQRILPTDAMRKYRKEMNLRNCKLIVIATSVNKFSVADPNDFNMLDIVGFDADTLKIIHDFVLE